MWRLGLLSLALVAACAPDLASRANRGAILILGDDLVAGETFRAELSAATGRPVVTAARPNARMTHPLPTGRIAGREVVSQYRPDAYSWVVITGGAADLARECGCARCDDTLDEIVGLTGRGGALPDLVTQVTQGRSRVLMLGYPAPAAGGACTDEVRELNNRFSRLADVRVDVSYVSAAKRFGADGAPSQSLGTLIAEAIADQ